MLSLLRWTVIMIDINSEVDDGLDQVDHDQSHRNEYQVWQWSQECKFSLRSLFWLFLISDLFLSFFQTNMFWTLFKQSVRHPRHQYRSPEWFSSLWQVPPPGCSSSLALSTSGTWRNTYGTFCPEMHYAIIFSFKVLKKGSF